MDDVLLEKLSCVYCRGPSLKRTSGMLICTGCQHSVSLRDGIPDFLSGTYNGGEDEEEEWQYPDRYEANLLSFSDRLINIDRFLLSSVHGDVLEVGCGTGRLSAPVKARGGRYFGLDPSFPFLQYAAEHRHLRRLVYGRGEKLPFHDGAFDCLISGWFAYRYVNSDEGLPEARRVLKTNGYFAFDLLSHWTVKAYELKGRIGNRQLRGFSWRSPRDTFEFTRLSTLKRQAEQAGFSVESAISLPFMPSFLCSNKYVQSIYFRGKKTIHLGRNVVIVLKAL